MYKEKTKTETKIDVWLLIELIFSIHSNNSPLISRIDPDSFSFHLLTNRKNKFELMSN